VVEIGTLGRRGGEDGEEKKGREKLVAKFVVFMTVAGLPHSHTGWINSAFCPIPTRQK
jgi:hypothetical protein